MSELKQKEFEILKKLLDKEKKIIGEIVSLSKSGGSDPQERSMIDSQIKELGIDLKKTSSSIVKNLEKVNLKKNLENPKVEAPILKKTPPQPVQKVFQTRSFDLDAEIQSLKKIRGAGEKKKVVKKKKASAYVAMANKLFANYSLNLIKKGHFRTLGRELAKAKLHYLPKSYISVILFSTLLSIFFAIFLTFFLMIFNVSVLYPFITLVEQDFVLRFAKVSWLLLAIPLGTYLFAYFYPSMERKSTSNAIDQELPFATIHMSAISGSLLEPSKIFEIIISTAEYPKLQRELVYLMNEMNVFGHDIVTALRNVAFKSPSKKLTELFNGLATTITAGGNLPVFFDKRAESYLFDYRLEREKSAKAAETFMDIYISVVIAAPMILMLLLMMMKISGFGIPMSTSTITLIMILGVTVVNIGFLAFLSFRNQGT